MLTDLQIANFAIIDEQTISFAPGLNVISGETGAGKSIILAAIELVLGGRASAQVIRDGSHSLEVRAAFDLSTLADEIRKEVPAEVSGEDLIITRTVSETGKGKVFINGKLASASLLQNLAGTLVSLCKQGQQMRLLDRTFHTEIVDLYGNLGDLRDHYQRAFTEWMKEQETLVVLEKKVAEGESRREELLDKIKELRAAAPEAGLREQLEHRVKLLKNSEKVLESYQRVTEVLGGDSSILSLARILATELERIHQHDQSISSSQILFESIRTELLELEADIMERASSCTLDEDEFEKLESQLAELARLHRKYRCDDQGLVALLAESEQELRLIENENALDELRKKVLKLKQQALEIAKKLSTQRRDVGEKLSRIVEPELHELNMPGARLRVEYSESDRLTIQGLETLELVIATNKGEPLKPLKQVASGGELSRILLVLKKVLQEKSGVHVLIFDEIDAGVSGSVARAVGEKLKALSLHSQVLCITHLPQIASLADRHLLVEKQVGKRTVSVVRALNDEQKIDEIARMLAGYKITAAARESARELLTSK